MKKFFSFLLLGLVLSIGSVWATTYKLTAVTSVEAGGLYVFEQNDHVLSNTVTSNALQTTGTYSTTGLSGTENYVWTLETATGGFYMKNVSLQSNPYLNNASGKTNMSFGTASSIWNISFTNGVALITNTSNNNRFLGDAGAGTPNNTYRAYASSNMGTYAHDFFVYKLEEEGTYGPSLSASPIAIAFGDVLKDEEVNNKTVQVSFANLTGSVSYSGLTAPFSATGSIASTGDVITISANTAVVGNYSQTLTIQSTADSKSVEVTVTMNVLDPNAPGMESNPYTVAQARTAIDGGGMVNNVYATGVVSSIPTAYDSEHGNVTFNMVDEVGDVDFLQAYRCAGEEAANVRVGDIVVVSGNLIKYNSTYEFAQGCQIISLIHPAVPSIIVATNAINATAEETDGTINVTYNNITNVAAEVYFCNAAGTEAATYDWVDADINAQNNVEYVIEANTGVARTAYMKVYALGDEAQDVYSEIITISQAEYVEPTPASTALVAWDLTANIFSFPEGSTNKTVTATDYTYGDYTINVAGSTGEGYYWHTDGYLLLGKSGATFTFPAFDFNVSKIKIYGRSSASGKVTFNMFVGADAVSTEVTSSKEDHEFEIAADKQEVGTIYTLKVTNANNCQIVKIEVFGYYELTLGTNGYSTYAAPFNYTVSGAEVYKAAYDELQNAVVLTEVENAVVPAGEGIILKGTEGASVTITPSAETASDFTGNQLFGTVAATLAPADSYVLATFEDGTKFNPCDENLVIPANKAYLVIAANSAPVRIIFAEDNATNIWNVKGSEKAVKFIENGKLFILREGVVYDATGRMVK